MLRVAYSPHQKAFTARIDTLRKSFAKYKRSISSRAFAKLPWASHPALAQVKGKGPFKHLVLVGMGGSSLGMKALCSALGINDITFLDNVDPDFVQVQIESLNLKKTLFLLVSKSGGTIEVLSIAEILFAKIKSARNFLTITDNSQGALAIFSKKKKIPCITSPADVPGRFSILSIAGLLPAALAGVNAGAMLTGAQDTSWEDAFTLAAHQFLHFKNGNNITVFFPYSEGLTYVAEWYIQLLSESIGKSAKVGITPVKALGVKDQHSQLQLYLDGPRDKVVTFVALGGNHQAKIPHAYEAFEEFAILGGKSIQELLDIERVATAQALAKNGCPNQTLLLRELSAHSLGQLLFLAQVETVFLGQLYDINPFDQPGVELIKKYIYGALHRPGYEIYQKELASLKKDKKFQI